MRAAVCRAFGQPLRIEEVEIDPPGPFQLAVAIEACAVCHSDIAYAEGAWGGDLPAVYGHEAAGRVTALGPGARGFAVGDPVLVTLIRACGGCPACAGGDPTSCARAWAAEPSPLRDGSGAPLAQGLKTAAFAESVVVDQSQCVALPADLPADLGCLLACGVITGVGSVVNAARVRPGASVAVAGVGGVGLNVVQGAALAGAAPIVAVDPIRAKLESARGFGATDGVPAGPDANAAIRGLTGGRGVDFAFVAVGAPTAIAEAGRWLAPGGTVVVVGMPPSDARVSYDPTRLASLNQSVIGVRMGRTVLARDVPWLIGHWRAGRLRLAELVTGRYPLERINEAIADVRSGAALRNVIVFGNGG
jgi:Zn-dependent alcohol dehydrogenase